MLFHEISEKEKKGNVEAKTNIVSCSFKPYNDTLIMILPSSKLTLFIVISKYSNTYQKRHLQNDDK